MRIIRLSTLTKEMMKKEMDKMEEWFDKRTSRHIDLVQKYCKIIEESNPNIFRGLVEQAKSHDSSKYEEPEYSLYVWITWDYKYKDDGKKLEIPEDIKEKIPLATEHHVKNNRHHPEFHSKETIGLINREDRDKPPSKMIDATKMNDVDIGEMCADWFAMSVEKGTNPKEWADKNVNVRWKFSDKQKSLIYDLINGIWIDIEDAGKFIDTCMDELYHHGLSIKGSFGYTANMASAKAASDLIRDGEYDIEKLSDAIHEGWASVVKTFDDPVYEKKPEKKKARLKLANTPYSELSEEEKDKDRVIAKIMIDYCTM